MINNIDVKNSLSMNECNSVLVVEKMNSSGTHYSVLLEITTLMTTLPLTHTRIECP